MKWCVSFLPGIYASNSNVFSLTQVSAPAIQIPIQKWLAWVLGQHFRHAVSPHVQTAASKSDGTILGVSRMAHIISTCTMSITLPIMFSEKMPTVLHGTGV